jgi:hypothetical protein
VENGRSKKQIIHVNYLTNGSVFLNYSKINSIIIIIINLNEEINLFHSLSTIISEINEIKHLSRVYRALLRGVVKFG